MLDVHSLGNLARIRHEEALKEAEIERLYKQIKGNQPSLFQRAGALLAATKQRLKGQIVVRSAHPAFNKK
jgi:hypothetical protein